MGLTDIERAARAATRAQYRTLGTEIARLRTDTGVGQRQLARAAGIDQGFLSRIEAGTAHPTLDSLQHLAAALGADLSLRLYPGTGPPLRDRHQSRMIEAFLRLLHPRWRATLEVAVRNPARGVIDAVIDDTYGPPVVAVEAESDVRRLEQQLRWAKEKAASLPSADVWPFLEPGGSAPRVVSRLLLLRSTTTSRAVARELGDTLATAYPAVASDILAALRGTATWPGDGLLWVRVEGNETTILERRPPSLGRPPRAGR